MSICRDNVSYVRKWKKKIYIYIGISVTFKFIFIFTILIDYYMTDGVWIVMMVNGGIHIYIYIIYISALLR